MIAVQADNLSKVYRFYEKPAHRLWEAVLRKPMHTAFKALEGVSFSIVKGETLGIVGENGAGKSTLLKILARTLQPSKGTINIYGKLAAMLELGAGFHQEFTGRQNIYLNASLLGLSDNEIKENEEKIIEFAELGPFIDRPLKSYSSGMVVRLAFAVSTCIDPEILVVDEALSVGDVRFQQKCIKKLNEFRKAGKTLIFCSHSMYQISEICTSAIWIDHGRIRSNGATSKVVSEFMTYLDSKNIAVNHDAQLAEKTVSKPEARVDALQVMDMSGNAIQKIPAMQDMMIRLKVKSAETFNGHIGAGIFDLEDRLVFGTSTKHCGLTPINLSATQTFEVCFKSIPLKRGSYVIKGFVLDSECLRVIHEYSTEPYNFFSERPDLGYINIQAEWLKV